MFDHSPVILTFDLDGEVSTRLCAEVNEPGIDDPEMGAFGPREGYKNILNLLDEHDIRGSFQIVGKVAELYPNTIKEISKAGHELAIHSYSHRDYQTLPKDELENEITQTLDIIHTLTGAKPTGHRTPYWKTNSEIFPLLEKYGIRWNSDAHTKLNSEETLAPFQIDGTSIWELPSSLSLDDWTCLLSEGYSNATVLNMWIRQLKIASSNNHPLVIVMHPFIIGQPRYLPVLDSIIRHVKEETKKSFLTPSEYLDKQVSVS